MNCEIVAANLTEIRKGTLPASQLLACRKHIERCPDCADALRGAGALAMLRARDTDRPRPGLFEEIAARADHVQRRRRSGSRFWVGTGFGGAIAASLFAVAMALGWVGAMQPTAVPAPGIAEFRVALGEPRNLDVAIEVDRALEGANVSVLLSDGIQLAGYGDTRELTWTTDLKPGVNRLSLPVIGTVEGGGQLVVRLRHPASEKMFVVQLDTEA